jgi:hypothetical protein
MKRIAVVVGLLSLSATVWADSPWVGTWVQRKPGILTMIVEETGNALKFSYKIVGPGAPADPIMTIQSQLDGKDVPVLINGQPTGQTTAIRRIDSHHTLTVMKYQGKETGTSKSEISADGKVLKVDNDNTVSSPNGTAGKSTQYWDKK